MTFAEFKTMVYFMLKAQGRHNDSFEEKDFEEWLEELLAYQPTDEFDIETGAALLGSSGFDGECQDIEEMETTFGVLSGGNPFQ